MEFKLLTTVLHMINILVLYIAVRQLLFKPIRKFMLARTDRVQAEMDKAKEAQDLAKSELKKYRDLLAESDKIAAKAALDGVARAQHQAEEIIGEAKLQSKDILQNAARDAETVKHNAMDSMRLDAAELAIEIAAKVLAREVKKSDNDRLIEEFLTKVG